MQHAEISHRLDSSNPRDEVNLADDGALCLDAVQLLQTDVEEINDAPRLTIRQWREKYRTDRDHRMSDRWSSCLPLLITPGPARRHHCNLWGVRLKPRGRRQGDQPVARQRAACEDGAGVYELGDG